MRCRHRSKGYQDGRDPANIPHMRDTGITKSRQDAEDT